MKRIRISLLLVLVSATMYAQQFHVGIFGGIAAYNGDLTDKPFPKKVSNGAIGITLNYEFTDQIILRGGLTYAVVGGADRYSDKPDLAARNLSFETDIIELSAIAEYNLFNLYDRRYTPYAFAGLALYHFNPYAYQNGQKVYLKPLSTEGQGLAGYTDRKPYKLTQFSIPFGGGLKYAFSDKIRVGLELGMRKLFTDYLDDASKTYIDPNDLLTAKGPLAVAMSYRGDEVPGGDPTYPSKTTQRGNEKFKDWYYFTGLHLTYRIGSSGKGANKKNGVGCPVNVY